MDKKNKNILVVGQDSVGIIDVMLEGITQYTSYTYHYINFYPMERNFKYRNFSHRIKNFILKNTVGVNLKKKHFELQVTKSIAEKQPQYEMILIIRPDLLTDEHINQLRAKTSKLMTYYWDTTSFLPRQLSIARYFDYIYSFDPDDCSKYGFTFLPNFYFFDKPSNKCSFEVYYLSSLDERRPTIEKIAKRLKELNISYCFKGYD